MKRVVLFGSFVALLAAWGGGCQGPDEYFRSPGSASGTGGISVGTGGTTATGGMAPGTGGSAPGAGGVLGTGGRGLPGTGGTTATGGATGTGGRAATGGTPGTGGVIATGGTPGAAGAPATGAAGRAGTGGVAGAGGRSGAAGARGTGGAGGGANCVDSIRQMGYAYPGAPACSMCKDNTTDLSTKCTAMIDCIEKSYPCTGNCETNCLNMSGGSGVLATCVNALVAAACP